VAATNRLLVPAESMAEATALAPAGRASRAGLGGAAGRKKFYWGVKISSCRPPIVPKV